jgi:hypothetical protein
MSKSFGEWYGARSGKFMNELFGFGSGSKSMPSLSETMPWNKLKDFFDVHIDDLSKTIDPEKIEDLNKLHHDYEKLKKLLDDVVSRFYDLKSTHGGDSTKLGRVRDRSSSSLPKIYR